jgi:hypothetical protein
VVPCLLLRNTADRAYAGLLRACEYVEGDQTVMHALRTLFAIVVALGNTGCSNLVEPSPVLAALALSAAPETVEIDRRGNRRADWIVTSPCDSKPFSEAVRVVCIQ